MPLAVDEILGLPEALAAKAPAIVQDIEPSNYGPALKALIEDSFLSGKAGLRRLPEAPRRVEEPIDILIDKHMGAPCGLIGTGHAITFDFGPEGSPNHGKPMLDIHVKEDGPYLDIRYAQFERFMLRGAGTAGPMKLRCESGSKNIYNAVLRDLIIEGTIGDASLEFHGAFFESLVDRCIFAGSLGSSVAVHGGAPADPAAPKGVISTLRFFGCGFRKFGRHGLDIKPWARGVWVSHSDFIDGARHGICAPNGLQGVEFCTAENTCGDGTVDAAFRIDNYGHIRRCEFPANNGKQKYGFQSYLLGALKVDDCEALYTTGGTPFTPKLGRVTHGLEGNPAVLSTRALLVLRDCDGQTVDRPASLTTRVA